MCSLRMCLLEDQRGTCDFWFENDGVRSMNSFIRNPPKAKKERREKLMQT